MKSPQTSPAGRTHTGAPFRHLYLIDGSGYIFRAFLALPPMTRPDGTPVNAVFGFANMLFRLMQDRADDASSWWSSTTAARASATSSTTSTRRNRDEPPPELVPQFPLVREATRAFGLPAIEMEDYEADDLIATYARHAHEPRRAGDDRLLRQGPDAAGRPTASRCGTR